MRTLSILCILLIGILITSCGRKVVGYETHKENKGYRGEAARNPFLAAQLFLEEYEMVTGHSSRARYDPELYDTMVIPARSLRSESQIRRMLDYMRKGGHVIFLLEHGEKEYRDFNHYFSWGENAFDEELVSAFVDHFGVSLSADDETTYEDSEEKVIFEDAQRAYEIPYSRTVTINFKEREYEARFGTDWLLLDDGRGTKKGSGENLFSNISLTGETALHTVIKDEEEGKHKFISKGYGKRQGRVTLITDGRMLRNPHLATQNHPSVLLDILKLSDSSSVLFTSGESESFYSLLGKYYFYGLVGLLSLIFFWLLARWQRFGPVIENLPSNNLNYLKTLDSRGHFYWKHKKEAYLIRSMQKRAERVLGVEGSVAEVRRERFKSVAKELGEEATLIEAAFREAVVREPLYFIESVSILQKIIKHYE